MDLRAVRLALAAVLLGLLCPPASAQAPGEKVERGRAIYDQYCQICHGPEMMMGGGGAIYDLRRFPKDAKERFVRSLNEGRPPAMPPWKGQFSEEDIELLWAFVLSGGDPTRPLSGGR